MKIERALVGLLNNPVVPAVVAHAPDLGEYIDVIPDRLWYDFEFGEAGGRRFRRVTGAIEELKECAAGRVLGGHCIGLSLPSAIPLDMAMADEVASLARELNFQWFSEHLSMFLVAHGSVPNAQAGLGLPVAFDEESFEIIRRKLAVLKPMLGCRLLMENTAVFTPVPDSDMSEPQFLNRLYSVADCGMLLDLHNRYVCHQTAVLSRRHYLEQSNPACVEEILSAEGYELAGSYTASHSGLT